jgi:aspartyl-tRNA(Asn)/glutamyl-tRNA(Gln) amidotransferase subunit C
MAALDIDEVRAIARLARLRLDEAKVEALRHDLERILDHFSALAGVDVTGVEPTAHVLELTGGGRPDRPGSCLGRDKALDGAPDAGDGHFRVPRVIG